jgi:hypothetical protein
MVDNTPELCYLTHIVLRMFEDLDKHEDDPTRFRIEIAFSPGVTAPPSPVFGRCVRACLHVGVPASPEATVEPPTRMQPQWLLRTSLHKCACLVAHARAWFCVGHVCLCVCGVRAARRTT